ncbi:SPASM domain-containing protein [Sulfurimonas sp.]|nr:SPASM domain-containing protein [Sulfurimonas sp.]
MNDATKKNLDRKSQYIDKVQIHNDRPLFSWIDINLTELCNRSCIFCPRADESTYPNQHLHIAKELIEKMANELKEIKYEGSIVFAGFGEPMLHPDILELIKYFEGIRLEIVTNGDTLNSKLVKKLIENGIDIICISMYDGPEQVEKFTKMFEEASISSEYYLLRDRWHTQEDEYGLKLTNRAGMVTVGTQDEVDITKPCYYPHYSMTIDWNGDVLLCVQDWNKKVKMGNIYAQSLVDVWQSNQMKKYRKTLGHCDRSLSPCNNCNAEGTLHGFNHIKYWNEMK